MEVALEIIANTGVVLIDLLVLAMWRPDYLVYFPNLEYYWSLLSFVNLFNVFDHFEGTQKVKKLILMVWHGCGAVLPFLLIILANFFLFSFIGMWLYGGYINSALPEVYNRVTGSPEYRNYEKMSFNDFYSSLFYVYSMTMNNQLPVFVNMTSMARNNAYKDYSGLFFFVYAYLNEMILFNLLIGQVFGIVIEYYKTEIVEAKEAEQDIVEDELSFYSEYQQSQELLLN